MGRAMTKVLRGQFIRSISSRSRVDQGGHSLARFREGRMRMSRILAFLLVAVFCALCLAASAFASEVSVGSPSDTTPQNHQNEPAVAIDANHPNVAVAGWNEFADWAPCPQADALQFGTCADP